MMLGDADQRLLHGDGEPLQKSQVGFGDSLLVDVPPHVERISHHAEIGIEARIGARIRRACVVPDLRLKLVWERAEQLGEVVAPGSFSLRVQRQRLDPHLNAEGVADKGWHHEHLEATGRKRAHLVAPLSGEHERAGGVARSLSFGGLWGHATASYSDATRSWVEDRLTSQSQPLRGNLRLETTGGGPPSEGGPSTPSHVSVSGSPIVELLGANTFPSQRLRSSQVLTGELETARSTVDDECATVGAMAGNSDGTPNTILPTRRRGPGRPWKPGESGNYKGRPREIPDLDEMRDKHGIEVLTELVRLALHAKREAVRRAACSDLADRFFGKPAMAILAAVAEVPAVDADALRSALLGRLETLAAAGGAEVPPALPDAPAAAQVVEVEK